LSFLAQLMGINKLFVMLTSLAQWFQRGTVVYVDHAQGTAKRQRLPDQKPNTIRIVAFSDTHTMHRGLWVPPGDIFVHAGDAFAQWAYGHHEFAEFCDWMEKLPFERKVFCSGNHDRVLDPILPGIDPYKDPEYESSFECKFREFGIDYLWSGRQQLHMPEFDLNFWGCPWSLSNGKVSRNRAFQDDIYWVPPEPDDRCDIMITHGPPKGILDSTVWGIRVPGQYKGQGTQNVLDAAMVLKPKVHIFGHIHQNHGCLFGNDASLPHVPRELANTAFVNAANSNFSWFASRPAVVIDLPRKHIRR